MEFFPSTCHLSQSGSRDDLTGLWNVQYFADVWWDARALIRIPCNSKAAPCILASPSPRVEQLPAILFISRSRIPFLPSRYVTAVGTIRSRFPGRPVSRLDAIRSSPVHDDGAKGASSARPSRKTWVSIPSRKRRRSRPIIVRRAAKAA